MLNKILYNWVMREKSVSASGKKVNSLNDTRIFEKVLKNV